MIVRYCSLHFFTTLCMSLGARVSKIASGERMQEESGGWKESEKWKSGVMMKARRVKRMLHNVTIKIVSHTVATVKRCPLFQRSE